jgi:hypothetical protein
VPVAVDPASGSANFRSYNIKIDKNKFTPDTVIVNQWDTVRINFTSVDRDYDVKQPDFGFAVAIPKGTSGVWESSASGGGTFKFYCVACGGPESGPAGYLIVKASGE